MFSHISRETVIQCYRANEVSYSLGKKTKKVQKDVLKKTASISPKKYDRSAAYTAPLEQFENTNTPEQQYQVSVKKKKKKVLFNLCECDDYGTYKNHKPKTWDSITSYYGNADTTEIWKDPGNAKLPLEQDKKKYPAVETSDKFAKKHKRRSKSHKKRGHRFILQTPNDNNETSGNTGLAINKKENISNKEKEKKLEDKSKFLKRLSFSEKCPDAECAEEEIKNREYVCDCKINREPQLIAKQVSRNFISVNSMKDKLFCICHKYSQKFLNPKLTNINVVNKEQISRKRSIKSNKKVNEMVKKKQHEGEQTGEPFFEIKVSKKPRDMCVLNPIEIKENVLKYGRPEKNEPNCICPSRGRLTASEVCKSGLCKKAYKNKQIDFSCWCNKKIAECGDATCDNVFIGPKQKKQKKRHLRTPRINKPLLEVQLDMDKMCVVNPKEIQDKIINNISVDEICSSGVCREAALTNKTAYSCKCIRKKIHSDINECTEDTCTDATKKKKSKFSLLCTRICSRSENWIQRRRSDTPKRLKRRSFYEINPPKLRKEKFVTQSDNLVKETFELKQDIIPKLNIKKKDVGKPNPKKNINEQQEIMPKLNIKQKDVTKQSPKKNVNDQNIIVPLQKPRELKQNNPHKVKHVGISNDLKYRMDDVICACAHKCECDMDKVDNKKVVLKSTKDLEKEHRRKLARKRRNKRINDRNYAREMKKRAKLDKKGEKRSDKQRLKEIKLMQKKMQEEPLDVNFCTAILIGIVKIGLKTLFCLIGVILYAIRHPKKAYLYVMDRIRDPEGTFHKFRKWFRDSLTIKKLQAADTIRGSDTLTILADHFLDTPFYQTFANKGRTKEEQIAFEQKNKARKRRIRKREQQAIHSCRHMLLTTLRHTPCLWVYHICPNFYPQCLSLLAFMRSFSRILLFLVAFACWTPCILSFELCRAFLCCFMCTG